METIGRRMIRPLSALVGLLAVTALPQHSIAQSRLATPYDSAPAMPRKVTPLTYCPKPKPPVLDLVVGSSYANGDYKRSVPELAQARQKATAPLHKYISQVTTLADHSLMLTGAQRVQAAACVDLWLQAWLANGAMLGSVSWPDGSYERKWAVVALGMAYLSAHAGPNRGEAPAWLSKWFKQATAELPANYPDTSNAKNNHWYWAGLASVVAGAIANDRSRYAWGIKQYRMGLAAIDADGFLPLELQRGEGALGYHAFSASALVTIAAFEKANGRPLTDDDAVRLKKLVQRFLSGLADPSEFQKRAGAPQRMIDAAALRTYSWLEVYYALTADPVAEPWLRALRPMKVMWLGGDVTGAFGKTVKAGPSATSPLIKK
jgi:poly(beta-D-mannuronate) lyase